MILTESKIKGVYIIEEEKLGDERGYFSRIYCEKEFVKAGINFKPVQISQSWTKNKGTIRGLHYGREDKLVQCLWGRTFTVVVDLREDSDTYLHWISVNTKTLFVSKGCALGVQTLEDHTILQLFTDIEHNPVHEKGMMWNDPSVNIDWPIKEVILSKKDQNWVYRPKLYKDYLGA